MVKTMVLLTAKLHMELMLDRVLLVSLIEYERYGSNTLVGYDWGIGDFTVGFTTMISKLKLLEEHRQNR